MDEKYHGLELPWKFKIGVSGCVNSCAEPAVKDVGLIGTSKGWKVLVGGCNGVKPRIGQLLAENLSDEEAMNLVEKVINYYSSCQEAATAGSRRAALKDVGSLVPRL